MVQIVLQNFACQLFTISDPVTLYLHDFLELAVKRMTYSLDYFEQELSLIRASGSKFSRILVSDLNKYYVQFLLHFYAVRTRIRIIKYNLYIL